MIVTPFSVALQMKAYLYMFIILLLPEFSIPFLSLIIVSQNFQPLFDG